MSARSVRARPGKSARAIALEGLQRIDEGAYANLALPGILTRSSLDERDRAFATDLVYGTTRMRRACDFLVDRFLYRPVEPAVRRVLRLGAYQLAFLGTPPHAAVGETVTIAPPAARGLVNAVLRRVADQPVRQWPDDATRLSYPDWVVTALVDALGNADALAALEEMNEAATVIERPDGYVQDPASQAVAEATGVEAGDRVLDLCAAPGGKATAMASRNPAVVAAVDLNRARLGLVAANAAKLGAHAVAPVAADGRRPPFRDGAFDRVLLDAPCSGLGVLRRRPDARWRIEASDVADLAALQRQLLTAAVPLVAETGVLVYSVCTLTVQETLAIDGWLADEHPELVPLGPPLPAVPWQRAGRGWRVLPQAAGTDGMFVLRLSRRARQ